VDHDNDGYLAGSDGGPCGEVEQRFEASDCDDSNARIHPRNVEWLGDGKDWDCDGLDAPALCLDSGLEWVGDVPAACDEGNVIIQTRQTCNVCSDLGLAAKPPVNLNLVVWPSSSASFRLVYG
jgi:hypothetical protein